MSPDERWAAIVPIRSWTVGKSRLDIPAPWRPVFSEAFTRDVLAALQAQRSVERTIVVTADDAVTNGVQHGPGVEIVRDDEQGVNEAVAAGLSVIDDGPVLVVPADLPALTAQDLSEVIARAPARGHGFCSDIPGDGTTIVVSRYPAHLVTSYGVGSAGAHRARGFEQVEAAPRGARRDVDTMLHLMDADRIGVGRHTQQALVDFGRSLAHHNPVPA